MSAYERMLIRQMQTDFWGKNCFRHKDKSHLEDLNDPEKTREQADDTETTKRGKNDGTTTTHISAHI